VTASASSSTRQNAVKVRACERGITGCVRHVEVFRMGSVRASILGRHRPPSGHRRAPAPTPSTVPSPQTEWWRRRVKVVAIDSSAAFRSAVRRPQPRARVSVNHVHSRQACQRNRDFEGVGARQACPAPTPGLGRGHRPARFKTVWALSDQAPNRVRRPAEGHRRIVGRYTVRGSTRVNSPASLALT
jgi:hypothetical protein